MVNKAIVKANISFLIVKLEAKLDSISLIDG